MFYRQKILLALVEAFGGKLNNLDFQKYLFLFTQKCQKEKSYDFVPYKFGGFSFQSYADRRSLISSGHLLTEDDWSTKEAGYLNAVTKDDKEKILKFYEYYKNLSGDSLVAEVYKQFPYYAINSEIAGKLMSADELKKIQSCKPDNEDVCFFTIGYEGSSFEGYLNRLIKNNVKLLCDVRKNPLSRKYGFSKGTLSETLRKLGIAYIHMPELGIVSEKRQELNSKEDYNKLFAEYERTTLKNGTQYLESLLELLIKHQRVAITCFEAEECMCHRGRVAKALTQLPSWGYQIKHI